MCDFFLAPSRQAVASSEGLSRLVAFIGDKECADLHVLAVEVLSLCLGDATSMSVLQGSGSLQQLLSHILTSTDPIMKKNSTNTLAGAALNGMLSIVGPPGYVAGEYVTRPWPHQVGRCMFTCTVYKWFCYRFE